MSKVAGSALIEMLLAASPGESFRVGTAVWTSLDDRAFDVVEDCGDGESRFVTLDEDQAEIDPRAEYEVVR